MNGSRRSWTWRVSALAGLTVGCAEECGPEPMTTTRVTGVVTQGKKPVGRGWIEFIPSDGTVGNMRSAPIGPDGRFAAEGVAVGVNRIGIAGAHAVLPRFVRRCFDPLGSRVRRTILGGPSEPLTIDLLEEFARLDPPCPSDGGR